MERDPFAKIEKVLEWRRDGFFLEFAEALKKKKLLLFSSAASIHLKFKPVSCMCSNMHSFTALPFEIQHWDASCAQCGERGFALQEIYQLNRKAFFNRFSSQCISKNPLENLSTLKWECERGHTWTRSFKDALVDTRCSMCCVGVVEKKKGQVKVSLLDKIEKDTKFSVHLMRESEEGLIEVTATCSSGHTFKDRASKFTKDMRCPECTAEIEDRSRTTVKEIKFFYRCNQGHKWASTSAEAQACEQCLHDSKISYFDIERRILSIGGQCLTKFEGVKVLSDVLKWKCQCGESFKASTFQVFMKHEWCRACKMDTAPLEKKLKSWRLHRSEGKMCA